MTIASTSRPAPSPSEGQKAAGNYRKGHIRFHGLELIVETEKGAQRSGRDKSGRRWVVTMPATYGYIKRTNGADGDQVDFYLGPYRAGKDQKAFVIDQVDPVTGAFDEHKVMLGYRDAKDAIASFSRAFNDGRGVLRVGSVATFTLPELKGWLKRGDTTAPMVRKVFASGGAVGNGWDAFPLVESGGSGWDAFPLVNQPAPSSNTASGGWDAFPEQGPQADPLRDALRPYAVGRKAAPGTQWDVMGNPMPEAPATPNPNAKGGAWNNLTGALNESIYSALGAPADIANAALRSVNRDVSRKAGVAPSQYPAAPLFGSDWWARQFNQLGVNKPEDVAANTFPERVARGVGAGIGMTVVPEAALAGLGRAGVLGEGAVNAVAPYLGRSTSIADLAVNSAIGGLSGGAAEVAGGALPDRYRPLGEAVGGLLGGGLGALGVAGLGAATRLPGAVRDFRLSSPEAQEAEAARRLRAASEAGRPERTLADSLSEPENFELVPGSRPTTFQATGDMGIGALEAVAASADRTPFLQRRAEQNAARVGALEGIQPLGAPEAVSTELRAGLGRLDDASARAVNAATERAAGLTGKIGGELPQDVYGAQIRGLEAPRVEGARSAAQEAMQGLGGQNTPEAYGADLRDRLVTAKGAEKAQERAAWEAVDPDRSLFLPANETATTARRIASDMPATAKPLEGEEAQLFGIASSLGGGSVPFRDLDAFAKRLNAAMSQERRTNGETPTLARLTQLRAAVVRDMDIATIESGAAAGERAQGVPLEETFGDQARAVVGGADEWPGPVPGATMGPRGAAAEAPRAPASGGSDAVMNEAADIALGRKVPYRPPSFLKWIERNGGIRPDDDVVSVLDAADRRHGNLLNSSGRGVDDWGTAIAERAGWQDRPEQNEILDWISEAANGREPDWWKELHVNPEREQAARLAEHLTRIAAEEGIPLRSRQAALDLLRRDAELYGLGAPEARSRIKGRADQYGSEFAASGSRTATPGGGRGSGAGASGYPGGSAGGISGFPGEGGSARRGFGNSPRVEGVSPEGLGGSNFDDEALGRLQAAREATKTRAEKFGVSPIKDVLRSRGFADQFTMDSASVPGRVFQPGPTGFNNVQAYRRAVGDDAATAVLQDYAISSLRREGGLRPDGTLDPAGFERWRARYSDALRALPGLVARVGTAERASRFLDAAQIIPNGLLDGDVGRRVFRTGPGGFESVNRFINAVGDERARELLTDYAIRSLRDTGAVRGDGTLDAAKVATWRRQHADALRALPDVAQRLADPLKASEAIAEVAALRKRALDDYQRGAVGRLLGVDDPADVTRIVGGIFSRQDQVKEMGRLVRETANNPQAREGLRKAVADYFTQRVKSFTEAGTSGENLLKAAEFQKLMAQAAPTLRQVFSSEEVAAMQAIAADLHRANRSISSNKLPGMSNTAPELIAAAKNAGGQSWLGRLLAPEVASGAGAAAGSMVAGGLGAAVGSALASRLGRAAEGMRAAGLASVDDIIRDALLNPERARALLVKVPARVSPGAEMTLGQRYVRGAVTPTLGAMIEQ
ncbi:hypothetical protein V5F79_08225 [Xanthobacter flavus]|uniref:hypothetical protein n=1 Tax=Xanthobacter flavus TaxID=281 RepID=UPI0037262B2A